MDTRRMEYFSDAVFAIAATLLVLDLRLPGSGSAGHSLGYQLLHAWQEYFAYVVSFLTIGIIWVNHHTILAHVRWVTRPLLVLNLLLLIGVIAIPFPTGLVAQYLNHTGATAATVTYGLVMFLTWLGLGGMWAYIATHARQLETGRQPHELRRSVPRYAGGALGNVAGILVAAVVSPIIGLTIFGLVVIYYLFEQLPEPSVAVEFS
jgi:uncharacterized membrane protein